MEQLNISFFNQLHADREPRFGDQTRTISSTDNVVKYTINKLIKYTVQSSRIKAFDCTELMIQHSTLRAVSQAWRAEWAQELAVSHA
jgi:hypothetical protein